MSAARPPEGARTAAREGEGVSIRAARPPGLLAAVLDRDAQGRLVRKAGVMGVVIEGGAVRAGDPIAVKLPAGLHNALEPV